MSQLHEYFRRLSEGELDLSKTVEYKFIEKLQELDTPIKLNEFAKSLDMTSIVSNFISLMTKGGLISAGPSGLDTTIYDDLTTLQPATGSTSPGSGVSQVSSAPPASPPSVKSSVPGPRGSTTIPPARRPQQNSSSPPTNPPATNTSATSSNSGVPRPTNSGPPKPGSSGSSPPVKSSGPPAPGSSKAPSSPASVSPPSSGSNPSNPQSSGGPSRPGVPKPVSQSGPPSPRSSRKSQSQEDDLPEHIQQKLDEERAKTGRSKGAEDNDIDKDFDSLGPLDLDD